MTTHDGETLERFPTRITHRIYLDRGHLFFPRFNLFGRIEGIFFDRSAFSGKTAGRIVVSRGIRLEGGLHTEFAADVSLIAYRGSAIRGGTIRSLHFTSRRFGLSAFTWNPSLPPPVRLPYVRAGTRAEQTKAMRACVVPLPENRGN